MKSVFYTRTAISLHWLTLVLIACGFTLAAQLKLVHVTLSYTLLMLVVIHAAAALKHHVVDRDDVLRRMLPFVKPSGE